ncbi:MAG TPA: glycosyltransferase family 4 protein [Nitrososphaerales archaeon]|nr:glycosyltransferase family 4 protein [Nitrososphaerales archaeon]
MRIVYLLLHDFRFESIGLKEFAFHRFHFSKEYARRMAALGHEVKLYVISGGIFRTQVIQMDGYELKAFRSSFQFPPLMKFGNNHSIEVMRELDRDSPDLVHFHNYYLWNFPYIAPRVKRKGATLVAQYHGTDPIRRAKAAAFYPSLRLCDLLIVPTRQEERFLTRTLRLPSERVTRLPSTGVDTRVFKRVRPPDPEPVLTYVGRIPLPTSYRWEKAPHLLLPLFKALMDFGVTAKLVVAGDGPGLPMMKASTARLGIVNSIEFLGTVDQGTLPELYSRSRLTLVPLQMDDIEPFWGGTVQESLACGTPVVAFNDSNPGPRRFGLLVRPGWQGARLIADSIAEADFLSKAGKEGSDFVKTHCDWESVTTKVASIYQRLHPGPRRR